MMQLVDQSATALARMLRDGQVSAVEVMQATLARIAQVNPDVNAIVSMMDQDQLLAAAQQADRAPAIGALHGLPMAIKDLAHVEGMPTSMGSPGFAGHLAARSDPHVARMQAAGGIVLGKTNTPEFGLGSHTYNPVFGATVNAMRPAVSAGGSSGGAAVALARGMVAVADGSDMMGSLRNPAGWNGVYGMRPSVGLVPGGPEGDLFAHPLSTNGPMGRSVADVALLLEVMAGPLPGQPLMHDLAPAELDVDISGRRIAWLGDWGNAWPMEAGVLDHCAAEVQRFTQAGCLVEAVAPPFDAAALWEAWTTLRSWAVAGMLGPVFDAQPDLLKPEAVWEISHGRALSVAAITRASALRSDWYRAAAQLFERYDAFVVPTAQCWPFPVTWDWPKTIGAVEMDTYHRWMECVIPVSLIGLPCLAVPTGGPMGLQIAGPTRADRQVLQLGRAWEAICA